MLTNGCNYIVTKYNFTNFNVNRNMISFWTPNNIWWNCHNMVLIKTGSCKVLLKACNNSVNNALVQSLNWLILILSSPIPGSKFTNNMPWNNHISAMANHAYLVHMRPHACLVPMSTFFRCTIKGILSQCIPTHNHPIQMLCQVSKKLQRRVLDAAQSNTNQPPPPIDSILHSLGNATNIPKIMLVIPLLPSPIRQKI